MVLKFETLFTIQVEHNYFSDNLFRGFKISPTDDSRQLMKRYGIIYRAVPGGFTILFESFFAGEERNREKLLAEELVFHFRMQLTDQLFYNYTASVPTDLSDKIFWFSNVDEKRKPKKNQKILHQDEFAGPAEALLLAVLRKKQEDILIQAGQADAKNMILFAWPGGPSFNELYFSRPFGFIEIQLNNLLEEKMNIRFSTMSTFWRYVLLSDYLQNWPDAAIIDNSSGKKLQGPEALTLPDGRTVKSFITEKPVELTQKRNTSFQLIEHYDPSNDQQSKDQNVLPNPDISNVSKINFSGNIVIKKNISNILL
jgi:hypothetical protein